MLWLADGPLLVPRCAIVAGVSSEISTAGTRTIVRAFHATPTEANMGRGILLWLLGVPIPIIILLALFWH
jgi:hypothetical protein